VTRRAATRLIDQLVKGALEADSVRLHGAIVATFELFPGTTAADLVFEPALAALGGRVDARKRASAAIRRHRRIYAG
jgi:hypothetical protein